ncbi:MAG: hypothetical protein P8127_08650 [Acidobacteriota bacterium]
MLGEKMEVELLELGIRYLFNNTNCGRSRSLGEVSWTVGPGIDQHRGAGVRHQVGMFARRAPGREEQTLEIFCGRKPNQTRVRLAIVVGSENAKQLVLEHLTQNLHVAQVTAHGVAHPSTSIIGRCSGAVSLAASEEEEARLSPELRSSKSKTSAVPTQASSTRCPAVIREQSAARSPNQIEQPLDPGLLPLN